MGVMDPHWYSVQGILTRIPGLKGRDSREDGCVRVCVCLTSCHQSSFTVRPDQCEVLSITYSYSVRSIMYKQS